MTKSTTTAAQATARDGATARAGAIARAGAGLGLCLSSGLRCALTRRTLPGLQTYYVLALRTKDCSSSDVGELQSLAHRIGRMLARRHYGDPECYSLLYNAARTRRRPWPHVHILVARSVADKRWCMLVFQLKHLLRWRRWPLVRRVVELG